MLWRHVWEINGVGPSGAFIHKFLTMRAGKKPCPSWSKALSELVKNPVRAGKKPCLRHGWHAPGTIKLLEQLGPCAGGQRPVPGRWRPAACSGPRLRP